MLPIHAAHKAGHLLNGTTSGLGVAEPFLRVDSGVLLGGEVCVYGPASLRPASPTTPSRLASCALDCGGTLVRVRPGSCSSGAYRLAMEHKETVQGREKCPTTGSGSRPYLKTNT